MADPPAVPFCCRHLVVALDDELSALGTKGHGCGGVDLNHRPSGYGPDELPLLYPAVYPLNGCASLHSINR